MVEEHRLGSSPSVRSSLRVIEPHQARRMSWRAAFGFSMPRLRRTTIYSRGAQ